MENFEVILVCIALYVQFWFGMPSVWKSGVLSSQLAKSSKEGAVSEDTDFRTQSSHILCETTQMGM